ncbi:MAG TPA: alpha/beta fold hydrolase, partial [Candidatus Nanoarchaeia archaeon]|nr:alpha/beta fold hydrolase [Candidatus Nanoarchaeia archaeon]
DQRGCGKSTPLYSTKHNTTQYLISDIEKLRKHLKIESFYVFGGSWGSTMALLYTIAFPKRVKKLMMYGVYLATQEETDFVNEGYPQLAYPEAWERFISLVPVKHRKNGDSIMEYYAKQIWSKNKRIAKKYADEWSLWEWAVMSFNYDPKKIEREVMSFDNTAVAKFETRYFLNKCFIPEGYILKNVRKIQHIPCFVVQGRFDLCTPSSLGAYKLAKAYGKKLKLQLTLGGHLASEPENFKVIRPLILAQFSR